VRWRLAELFLLSDPEDGENMLLRNFGELLLNYMTSHPRKLFLIREAFALWP
jgi:hypothetical protein